ncbi:MAG TPA: RHS repeat-associated core domain-containing protein [Acidobacteriaceae bacterium]|nr:RHS repeat-associated core domain-containing protein [Acidobacteriaceae bacterium]
MQLSFDVQIPDGLLAANALLREKPHQGVPSWNLALHQGIDERNSTAAIGIRASAQLNRIWPRYTGKERDAESGLDYFGARYYASNMGRWMSPDWAESPEAVPYAKLANPQSLNLYGYALNNPLSKSDPDGHCVVDGETHGGTWCFFHKIGFVETQKEQTADARFYANLYAQNHKGFDPSKLSDTQVLNAYKNGAFANDAAPDPFQLLGAVSAPIGAAPSLDTGNWHQGGYDSAVDSLLDHYKAHGEEVGAKSEQDYLRKAEAFKDYVKQGGATKKAIEGVTENVTRYYKNGKYIDLTRDGKIISFGKQ